MESAFDFSFVPTLGILISAALAFVSAVTVICITVTRMRRIQKKSQDDSHALLPEDAELPKVSVVVYARDDADQLASLLPSILQQDYPERKLEVVVVNEGQSDATAEVVNTLALRYPNLYLTFTPDGARNLSRKKLALTLGIKAARYPVVAMIDADTSLSSPQWLRRMAGHFADETCEVVIGASSWDGESDDRFGARRRSFDFTADTVTYLASAINGHPYRGTSHNLFYRRGLFFANKGFSRSLNLRNGDDDIFVSEIADGYNTEVEISPESITVVMADNPVRTYRDMCCSRILTGQHVSKSSSRLMGSCSLLEWIWLFSAVYCTVSGLPSLLPASVMLGIGIILWVSLSLSWRGCTSLFGGRTLGWSLPGFIIARPFYTFTNTLRAFRRRKRQYTWS